MLKSSSLCLYSSNLGIFWLKIEQFWPFEEIYIFSNGGHLGYRTVLTDTILKGDLTKNRNFFKWPKLLYLSQKMPKFELYKHNDELFSSPGPKVQVNYCHHLAISFREEDL
jgi:hypothetical protein